jgi:5-methylcytosine-specific restriction protein A
MTPPEVERLFTDLTFECDVRRPPDDARARQFRMGWEDATVRDGIYGEATLSRLTWRNLGYRFGQHVGQRPIDAIDAIYRILALGYSRLWVPRSYEDHLLQEYWRRVGGRLYVEVPIGAAGGLGDWPVGSTRRRLDAVRLMNAGDPAIVRFAVPEFRARVESLGVELIEAKRSLNRGAIGQVVAGRDMFRREYGVAAQCSVIVCGSTDDALLWACRQQDIRVEVVAVNP